VAIHARVRTAAALHPPPGRDRCGGSNDWHWCRAPGSFGSILTISGGASEFGCLGPTLKRLNYQKSLTKAHNGNCSKKAHNGGYNNSKA
jgi:hypothetical protein